MEPAARSHFKLDGNTLNAWGHLSPEAVAEFSAVVKKLTKSEHRSVLLDLRDVTYMSSCYLGVISAATIELKESGRAVLIKAQRQVCRLFQLAGIDKLAEVQTCPARLA